MVKLYYILLLVLLNSCFMSVDYYQSDKYKIKQRQKASMEMFEKTHSVRRKCSPHIWKHKKKRRKQYYS